MEIETSNLVGRLTVASASPRMAHRLVKLRKQFTFGWHQPYLWNGWSSQVLST